MTVYIFYVILDRQVSEKKAYLRLRFGPFRLKRYPGVIKLKRGLQRF